MSAEFITILMLDAAAGNFFNGLSGTGDDWTNDLIRALRFTDRLEAEMIWGS